MSSNEARLRRHIRALAALNRQLYADLEGTDVRAIAPPPGTLEPEHRAGGRRVSATGARRGGLGATWIEQLGLVAGAHTPFLAHAPDRGNLLVEGDVARPVPSAVLVAGLAGVFGKPREVDDQEAGSWSPGPPVEVLEGPKGAPFVIAGGRRLPLRGLPLPHPVDAADMQRFPEGPELNLSLAIVSRARFHDALTGRLQLRRLGHALRGRGELKTLGRRARIAARRDAND